MPLDDQVVEVSGSLGREHAQDEVIHHQQVGREDRRISPSKELSARE
ncbi:MAG: hypothetical protein ABSF14_21225 [Terriglobia bacterium]